MMKWHEEAREMKRSGASLQQIADKFGVARTYVCSLTSDIPSTYKFKAGRPVGSRNPRVFSGAVGGFQVGSFKRVAVSFTDDQVAFVNAEAERTGKSFSATVADMVDRVRHLSSEDRAAA